MYSVEFFMANHNCFLVEACTWEDAVERFTNCIKDPQCVACSVYYEDSRGYGRTCLEYHQPEE